MLLSSSCCQLGSVHCTQSWDAQVLSVFDVIYLSTMSVGVAGLLAIFGLFKPLNVAVADFMPPYGSHKRAVVGLLSGHVMWMQGLVCSRFDASV